MSISIVTVDALLVAKGHVLMIRRAKEPYLDKLALPGGHVEEGETLLSAVVRELEEEVGVVIVPDQLDYLLKLCGEGRDPRPGHTLSHVFWAQVEPSVLISAKAASDAKSVHVVAIEELESEHCAFDHWLAIKHIKEVLHANRKSA